MELAFATKSLRALCESGSRAKRELGITVAEQLKARLADLRAARHVTDVVAGRPHEIDGTSHREVAVDLGEDSHVVFCANHNMTPSLESGGVDWSKVSRIKILRIESKDGRKE